MSVKEENKTTAAADTITSSLAEKVEATISTDKAANSKTSHKTSIKTIKTEQSKRYILFIFLSTSFPLTIENCKHQLKTQEFRCRIADGGVLQGKNRLNAYAAIGSTLEYVTSIMTIGSLCNTHIQLANMVITR